MSSYGTLDCNKGIGFQNETFAQPKSDIKDGSVTCRARSDFACMLMMVVREKQSWTYCSAQWKRLAARLQSGKIYSASLM